MEKYSIFVPETITDDSLYAIKYNEYDKNEFRRLFDNWSDPEYLENFFEAHKEDLQRDIFDNISVEEAIISTLDEAAELERIFLETAEEGKTDNQNNLQTLFKPLNDSDKIKYPIPDHQKNKAYGNNYPSWLRIYAIRLEPNVFIVSGGAIKLRKTMNDRPHLQEELEKLHIVREFLIEEGIVAKEDVVEFFEL